MEERIDDYQNFKIEVDNQMTKLNRENSDLKELVDDLKARLASDNQAKLEDLKNLVEDLN